MNINDLHQLPESHPVSKRERISLAHIDVAGGLRRNRESFARSQAKSRKINEVTASEFSIGQAVRTKLNDRGTAYPLVGKVVSIDGSNVTLDNGRTFAARRITAI